MKDIEVFLDRPYSSGMVPPNAADFRLSFSDHPPRTGYFGEFYAIVRALISAGFCCLLLIGCGPLTVPSDGSKPHNDDKPPIVEPLDGEAVFSALADLCEPKVDPVSKKVIPAKIRDTYRLARVVNNCGLSDDEIAKFDAAFVDAANKDKQRDLTSADAERLRGLK